jgi:hypothetical protein
MSVWTDFVKQYAAMHKMSYAQALKDPNCSKQYREKKGEAPSHLKHVSAKLYKKNDQAKEAMLKFQEAKMKRKAKKAKFGSEPDAGFGVVMHY